MIISSKAPLQKRPGDSPVKLERSGGIQIGIRRIVAKCEVEKKTTLPTKRGEDFN